MLVGTFNQEKALIGAFSMILQLHRLIVCSTSLLTRVHGGGQVTVAPPPALGGRPQQPGLHPRHLGLPRGHVHVINVDVRPGARGADKYPRLLRGSGVGV